jgi:hypothetical protein
VNRLKDCNCGLKGLSEPSIDEYVVAIYDRIKQLNNGNTKLQASTIRTILNALSNYSGEENCNKSLAKNQSQFLYENYEVRQYLTAKLSNISDTDINDTLFGYCSVSSLSNEELGIKPFDKAEYTTKTDKAINTTFIDVPDWALYAGGGIIAYLAYRIIK